jgi:cell division septation protein DedD
VGAFAERQGAGELTRKLGQAGFAARVVEVPGGRAPFKVRVGPVASREEAERLASVLASRHQLPTWVVSRDRE